MKSGNAGETGGIEKTPSPEMTDLNSPSQGGLLHTKFSTLGQMKALLIQYMGEKDGTKFYNQFMNSFVMQMVEQVQQTAQQTQQGS